MAVTNPPAFIQSGGETAEIVRRYTHAQQDGRGGIVSAGDLAVSENGTPNMSVNVAAGRVFLPGTESSFQGIYFAEARSVTNVAIAAADPTNPRKDLIVAKVQDAAYSGGVNTWSLVAVTGTPAPSPAEPAVPANGFVLAMVDVPALDTAITNSQITDRRTSQAGQLGRAAALGGVIVCTSATRPAHQEGRAIYETDTDKVLYSDGTNWTLPKNRAGGLLAAPAQATANQGSITTEVDITSLSVTADPGSNRRIKVSVFITRASSTIAGDTALVTIYEGSTAKQEIRVEMSTASVGKDSIQGWFTYVPSSGSKTWKATAQRIGTGTLTLVGAAATPMQLTVEDIGGI